MNRFTTIFIVLALICVSAICCGGDDPAAPRPEPATTGTVVVNASPGTVTCSWSLTGPDSYVHNGTDDETLTELEPGDYTLTWIAMSGWNRPVPAVETKTLAAGETTTFSGTFVQQAGTVNIDAEPDIINAPWTLTGPDSYSHNGTGDETLTGLIPGSYTITWGAVSEYDSPDPDTETLVLADEGTLTFSGTYTEQSVQTGTVNVRPQNATDAPWHLDGPNSYSYDGQGFESLTNMAAGEYTVTWGAVSGYTTPDPVTQTLAEGGSISLLGGYTAQTGDINVDANPDAIDAPWHMDGPDGWTWDGTGDIQMTNRPWGDYTITWGAVSGWDLPDPATETLTLSGSAWQITFTGNYTQAWDPDMVLISADKFQMGSPVTELGRNDNETQHWVQVSSFYICTTEITNAHYQFVVPEHAYNPGEENRAIKNHSRMTWFEFCNVLSVKKGLTPCYTISGSDDNGVDVICDWNANGYRMATEAEWEYACRAGSTTAFANGEITNTTCDDPVLDLIAQYCGNDPYKVPEVRTKIPNAWGLYDMHGNVNEMVWDRYGVYGTGTFENPDIDPTGPATGNSFVYRDYGSGYARNCRAAVRPWSSGPYAGLRIVRNAE